MTKKNDSGILNPSHVSIEETEILGEDLEERYSSKKYIEEKKLWAKDLKKRFAEMIREKNKTQYIVYGKDGHAFRKDPDGTITRIS